MNKFKILPFLIVIIFLGSNSLLAQQQQIIMEEVLDSYQIIGINLSRRSTEGISQEVENIILNTQKLKSNIPEEKAKQFTTLMNRIDNHAKNLLNENDIELLREKYDLLSHDVIGYLNTFGSRNEYNIYNCAGDLMPWVQEWKEQKDPYCKIPCGKIISVIK